MVMIDKKKISSSAYFIRMYMYLFLSSLDEVLMATIHWSDIHGHGLNLDKHEKKGALLKSKQSSPQRDVPPAHIFALRGDHEHGIGDSPYSALASNRESDSDVRASITGQAVFITIGSTSLKASIVPTTRRLPLPCYVTIIIQCRVRITRVRLLRRQIFPHCSRIVSPQFQSLREEENLVEDSHANTGS